MTTTTLDNGMQIMLNDTKGTDTVSVLVLVRVGSRYEYPEINGASHFIEHLMFKGTKRRMTAQHISRALDSIGADYNAFTSKNITGYYIKVAKKHASLAVDILQDMLFHSVFDAEEMDRERQVIIEEINMYQENPMMHVEDLLETTMFDGSTLGWEIVGSHKTMLGMTRDAVLDFYQKYYQPSNMVLSIAGNIPASLKKDIEKRFGKKKTSREEFDVFEGIVSTSQKEISIGLQHKPTKQIQLALGFPSYGIDDDRNAALKLLGIILGGNMSSRLFVEVRERRGLAYFVRASNTAYEDIGNFMIRAGLDASRLKLATKTILDELRKIKKDGVSAKELKEAKTFLQGKMAISLEDSFHTAQWYANQKMFHTRVRSPKAVLKRIEKVSRKDVLAVANEILDKKAMSVAAVGPFKTTAQLKKAMGI